MSKGNKTLADVQPGGMVRLGDQVERARFEAFLRGNPLIALSAGTAWQVWQAALSAQLSPATCKEGLQVQPSPGGQGDALKALDDLAAFCSDDTATVDRHVAVIRAALAARQPVGDHLAQDRKMVSQPVGQIVGYMDPDAEFLLPRPDGCVLMGKIEVCLWRTPSGKYTKPLYDAPAQAVDHQAALLAEERAHGKTIDQRDRCEEVADELADHIARITGVDIGEHSSANCPWQNAIEAAEEYKPAQAVDLGRARASIQSLLNWIDDWAETPEESGIDAIEAEAEAVLDLIDKAVGNG